MTRQKLVFHLVALRGARERPPEARIFFFDRFMSGFCCNTDKLLANIVLVAEHESFSDKINRVMVIRPDQVRLIVGSEQVIHLNAVPNA